MKEDQIVASVNELVSLAEEGKWEIAFEKFYDQNLEKADSDGVLVQGKEQNLIIGKAFASKISNVRDFSCAGKIVKGNRSFISWSFDFDVDGIPLKIVEIAIQDWENGKIVKERFFV